MALLALLVIPACQIPRHAEPDRISHREDLIHPPPRRASVDHAMQPIPDEAFKAARLGMDWLMTHRNENGSWASPYPAAVSALALSAALRDERMSETGFPLYWENTIQYLLSRQKKDGTFSRAAAAEWPYEHALVTKALADALLIYADSIPELRQAVKRGIRRILDGQQPAGGWHYGYATGRNRSTPLTVVQMDALFSALQQGMYEDEIQAALHRAADDLARMQRDGSGRYGYLYRGVGQPVMNGYALYGLQLAGWGLSHSARRGWMDALHATPSWPETLQWPLFAAYYNHRATYHHGGLPWRQWEAHVYRELLAGQSEEGAWTAPFRERALGPAYATALSLLMIHTAAHSSPLLSHYVQAPPGPLYRIGGADPTSFILASTLIESDDGFLLDVFLTDLLHQVERVHVEGAPRVWFQHLSEAATHHMEHETPQPLPREIRNELNRLFSVPARHAAVWDHAPPWAIAFLVWGKALEDMERDFNDMLEHQLGIRLPPGQRSESIVPPSTYADAFAALTHEQGLQLLQHALALYRELPLILDHLADAWCAGDEEQLTAWTERLLGDDPATLAVFDRIARPLRAHLTEAVLERLTGGETALFVLPAWHLYGDEGVMEQLRAHGLELERVP